MLHQPCKDCRPIEGVDTFFVLLQLFCSVFWYYFLWSCSANNIWVDTLFPHSCCSQNYGYWSPNFAIFFLMQAIFCTYSPVFDCTELYLTLLLVMSEVLHQTLNNYIIVLYYTLNKQRLRRTSCVTAIKRTSKIFFWCGNWEEYSGEIQKRAFEEYFDPPLHQRKERKWKESLKPGRPEGRRLPQFRPLVGESLGNERKVKKFDLTGVLQEEAAHPW